MVREAEIVRKVKEYLKSCDLKKTTNSIILHHLQSHFGLDLSDRKPLLRLCVAHFLQTYCYDNDNDNDNDHNVADDAFINPAYDDHHHHNTAASDVEGENQNKGFSIQLLRGISNNSLHRPAQQNKEKNKKVCFSGKYCTLSPELQKFLGVPHMTRTEIVRELWNYVKKKKLQDPNDGKNIICDETLRGLFEVDIINILQINKALAKHIWPQAKRRKGDKLRKQEKEEEVKSLSKEKPRKQERGEDLCGEETKEKRQKKNLSGFLAPLPLSDTLIRFLGTGETALTRADSIKRVWDYIKLKQLQDPSDRKTIICDEKLKELFNLDTFHGFSVSKLLSPHFVKM
ncbi:hypothetical protein vseg_015652 [Gypsophila vaccaria]